MIIVKEKIKNMKKKMKGMESPILIICPVCGFSFKAFDIQSKEMKKECPMCGYHISQFEKVKEFGDFNLNSNLNIN